MKSPYSPTYAEARQQFLEAARAGDAAIDSHALDLLGPAGESLARRPAPAGPLETSW